MLNNNNIRLKHIENVTRFKFSHPTTPVQSYLSSNSADAFIAATRNIPDKINNLIKKLTPKIDQDIVENCFVIDKKGDLIPQLSKKGMANFAELSKEEMKLISSQKGCAILHNHPEEITLSAGDVSNIIDLNLDQITAVTPGKGCYTLKRTEKFDESKSDEMKKHIQNVTFEELGIIGQLSRDEKASRPDKLRMLNSWRKDRWQEFATKYNLEYEHKEGQYISKNEVLPLSNSYYYEDYYE